MNYTLICTDIDGTLLNADRYLSDATVSAFGNLPTDKAGANFPVVLASSRMPSAMHYLQKGLGIQNAPLIAYNGGLILGENGICIESNTMPLIVLEDLLTHHKKHTYNLSIYADDDWFTDQEDFWSLREINNTRVTPTYQEGSESYTFLKTNQRAPHKLMCMGDASEIDSIVSYLADRHDKEVHLYRSKDTYLEITPKYIDKAKALQILLEHSFDFGMDKVIAFGDNHNDEELLKHAGFGVAVANATDKLKAIANYTSAFKNKEDAVAKAIEEFVHL
ncbi:Cof-type HAD-IIB family hydrolase [uncultured Dokdonia sp.]|uniref:Cof-type HAD-IIB family hydrolase n=1 Tax=uncultured Dokdonia sp. TaxID=575653 RepID=UPI0026031D83|nr:Cof-type HAD-IIB family hydrolase [uncultured Dokdonia sp.]